MMDNDQFFTIKEFASLIKVHPNTVRRAILDGRLKAYRLNDKKKSIYRIHKSEIEKMIVVD